MENGFWMGWMRRGKLGACASCGDEEELGSENAGFSVGYEP